MGMGDETDWDVINEHTLVCSTGMGLSDSHRNTTLGGCYSKKVTTKISTLAGVKNHKKTRFEEKITKLSDSGADTSTVPKAEIKPRHRPYAFPEK